jgi:DNA-binding MarR family transcriptional regulator
VDEEDTASVVEVLARLAFVMTARLEERASEAEVSLQQLRLLGILRDRRPTINELTVHLGIDKSSFSGLVIRAERRGLVSRTQHEQDGRAVRVRLEPAGRAIVDAADALFAADVQRIFSTLSAAERARWVALSQRVVVAEAADRGVSV